MVSAYKERSNSIVLQNEKVKFQIYNNNDHVSIVRVKDRKGSYLIIPIEFVKPIAEELLQITVLGEINARKSS
jgi:hypothetical protein